MEAYTLGKHRASSPALLDGLSDAQAASADLDENTSTQAGLWFGQLLDKLGAPRPPPPGGISDEHSRQKEEATRRITHHLTSLPGTLHQSKSAPVIVAPEEDGELNGAIEEYNSHRSLSGDKARAGKQCPCASCFAWLFSWAWRRPPEIVPSFDSPDSAVIIFDWDDTLLPTNFILEEVMPSMPSDRQESPVVEGMRAFDILHAHAHVVEAMLRTARRFARVAIITNSLEPWVEASARNYLPGLDMSVLLRELDITVYYSRRRVGSIPVTCSTEEYSIELDRRQDERIGMAIAHRQDGSVVVMQVKSDGLVNKWNMANPQLQVQPGDVIVDVNGKQKHDAVQECRKPVLLRMQLRREIPDRNVYEVAKQLDMVDCLRSMYGYRPWRWNVVSIGDSVIEQNALKHELEGQATRNSFSGYRPLCKTVNMLDRPSVEQAGCQLKLLMLWLDNIIRQEEDFDLFMDRIDDDIEKCLFRRKGEAEAGK